MIQKIIKIYRGLLLAMPVCVYFSFYPWIYLGSNGTTNFEWSVALIWLVLFGVMGVVLILVTGRVREVLKRWVWLLLPIYVSLSLIWTKDLMRGVLIAGVMWLLYAAGMSVVVLRDELEAGFWRRFVRVMLVSGLLMCGWCVVQCVLDVAGVPAENSLICAGCTYKVFGFPHPNGFAAEPQFMGNLLLAPMMLCAWLYLEGKGENCGLTRPKLLAGFLVYAATLFLTLSRGAIYAGMIGLAALTGVWVVRKRRESAAEVSSADSLGAKSVQRHDLSVVWLWLGVMLAFFVTLNFQGLMAEVSPTDDTYVSGVSKVINQLTLGKIDLGGAGVKKGAAKVDFGGALGGVAEDALEDGLKSVGPVENPVENSDGSAYESSEKTGVEGVGTSLEAHNDKNAKESAREEALFDGYVEVSTNERTNAWRAALVTWRKSFANAMFGTGLGGGPLAMYENGELATSRESVNNEYISLLLEVGVVGVVLFGMFVVMVGRAFWKSPAKGMLFPLILAYGASLCFFSGLPNALHIYLLPVALLVGLNKARR